MDNEDPNIPMFQALGDGRRAFREVAEELGITENTVRARYKKLTEAGVLEVTALVNPEMIEGHLTALVGMKVKSADLINAGERIASLKGVISVRVVTGRYDLLVEVFCADQEQFVNIVNDQIRPVDGIRVLEILTYLSLVKQTYNWGSA